MKSGPFYQRACPARQTPRAGNRQYQTPNTLWVSAYRRGAALGTEGRTLMGVRVAGSHRRTAHRVQTLRHIAQQRTHHSHDGTTHGMTRIGHGITVTDSVPSGHASSQHRPRRQSLRRACQLLFSINFTDLNRVQRRALSGSDRGCRRIRGSVQKSAAAYASDLNIKLFLAVSGIRSQNWRHHP